MRNPRLGAFLLLPGLLLAAACSAPSASPSGGAASGSTDPKPGGSLALRITGDPFDWDLSYVGKSIPNGDSQPFIYNSLLGYKTGPGLKHAELVLRPELAETWAVSPDGSTFTVRIPRADAG